jgi:hypothetical protein
VKSPSYPRKSPGAARPELSELDAVRESNRAIIAENSDEDAGFHGQSAICSSSATPISACAISASISFSLSQSLECRTRSENTPDANGRLIYAKINKRPRPERSSGVFSPRLGTAPADD